MAQILSRAQGAAIGCVMNLDPTIYVFQSYVRASAAEFAAQVMADVSMMNHAQAEVVVDPAVDRVRFNLRLGIGWNGQVDRAVDGFQFDRRGRKRIKLDLQVAVDGGEFGAASEIVRLQAAVNA